MPRRVKVGAHTWRIRLDEGTLGYAELAGHTRFDDCIIEISRFVKGSMRRDTLLHEVLHACLHPMNLSTDDEERVIRHLSPVLLGVLRDNPKLIAYLLDD